MTSQESFGDSKSSSLFSGCNWTERSGNKKFGGGYFWFDAELSLIAFVSLSAVSLEVLISIEQLQWHLRINLVMATWESAECSLQVFVYA